MINKTYLFTEKEVIALREAMIEYYQIIKKSTGNSPAFKEHLAIVKALKEQFKNDIH